MRILDLRGKTYSIPFARLWQHRLSHLVSLGFGKGGFSGCPICSRHGTNVRLARAFGLLCWHRTSHGLWRVVRAWWGGHITLDPLFINMTPGNRTLCKTLILAHAWLGSANHGLANRVCTTTDAHHNIWDWTRLGWKSDHRWGLLITNLKQPALSILCHALWEVHEWRLACSALTKCYHIVSLWSKWAWWENHFLVHVPAETSREKLVNAWEFERGGAKRIVRFWGENVL